MRCKDCDYPLWNLRARSCPECGKAFLPSEHEFVANSVRFCCSKCDQEYYGTDARGHLQPTSFDCVQCGERVEMDEMILRPSDGVEEAQTQANAMPWLERGREGVLKAWVRTLGRSMVSPGRLMRAVPPGSPMSAAWWYAALTILIISLAGAGLPLVVFGAGILIMAGDPDGIAIMLAGVWVPFCGIAAFLAVIVVWGIVIHGLLRVTGKVTHPIGRTYQTLCYSTGANVTSAVPCVGIYPFLEVGLIWWIVSAILMVAVAHRTTGARSSFAVLVFPLVGIVIAAASLVGAMYFGVSQARIAIAQQGAAKQNSETGIVMQGLLDFASENGTWPAHPVELIRDEKAAAWNFVSAGTATYLQGVPVAGGTLEALAATPDDRRDELFAAAITELPAEAIAFRFGDFVFCYPGIDPGVPSELWIVILAPDPDVNSGPTTLAPFIVGKHDGTTEVIERGQFESRLAEENDHRTRLGLAALPPPGEITHAKPSLGSERD